ncbi:diaminopimelate decarboxylase [Shewanella oneidensis MR-1]|uniref:Diaminopimelate decarboxylase n=1 Tax=Shewanella oneidensis (strain ATCC 700550 / JCM 31522 / CIP 106686 / LMG 19005 / NCIMB 14063 / MR-1) TaxID=211586 RepID=Q8E9H4_SHEON|nr:diaminopimelate decarboxylase [Shewanella oneidensis]AAN57278.1 diaminopimelate decarboxylase LysA [Shewanella oneidensis MR-1]MDX5998412.1 diaminopimelate decarboxylase [Shewanella oneidensis]MEE2029901.1 Diaminopimelate decarboxylase [Shewanella oneidensis]QKG94629.1 diaminopimelate decarboxylase [Shewanella oneidensis MR-1]
MDHFLYQDNTLYAEGCRVNDLAQTYGTPLYIYSRATLERHWHAFNNAVAGHPHLVCYAVKANSNLAVLNVLARLGSGFDIVSGGELARVIEAGGDPAKVVFSGVGKTVAEMEQALNLGIYCFNVESSAELEQLNLVAGRLGKVAPVSLRVNPDVDAGTHPYISTGLKENKFGIAMDEAEAVFARAHALPHLQVKGVDCHIGSQLTEIQPFLDAMDRMLSLIDRLAEQGIVIEHFDVGGGLGVTYDDETPPHPDVYAAALLKRLGHRKLKLIFEPGRAIAANAGIFVTEVLYLKENSDKRFAIVDGAMNDLIRPALYSAWQKIIPVTPRDDQAHVFDIVGPVCETGDFLGKDREFAIAPGDLLVVRSSGAYGFAMASNYNTRPRAAEVMVDGDKAYLVREREKLPQLWQGEQLLP